MAWPFSFGLTATEVQVRLGGWVVRRVRLDDIEAVSTASGPTALLTWGFNEHWCNFWPARYLILRRKSGWVRSFVINPPDTDPFVAELQRRDPRIGNGSAQ